MISSYMADQREQRKSSISGLLIYRGGIPYEQIDVSSEPSRVEL